MRFRDPSRTKYYAEIPGHEAIGPFDTRGKAMGCGLVFAATFLSHELANDNDPPRSGLVTFSFLEVP